MPNEIVGVDHLSLARAGLAGHSARRSDRPRTVFSGIAVILSYAENNAAMALLDAARAAGGVGEILSFDGALAKVTDFRDGEMLEVAADMANAVAGVEFQIKRLQRGVDHVRFARAVLRGSQTAVAQRKNSEREVATCIVSVADWAQLRTKTALDEESATMRSAIKTPQFTKETAENVFRRDSPKGAAYGVVEPQSALAPARCRDARILEGGCAGLWGPTAPSVEMHLRAADPGALEEGGDLKGVSAKTARADAGLPSDGGDVYASPAAGADGLLQPGPGLQRAVGTDGPFEARLWECARCSATLKQSAGMASRPDISRKVRDLHSAAEIAVKTWRRANKTCEITYGPNFMRVGGDEVNATTLADFEHSGVVIIRNQTETFSDEADDGRGKDFVTDYRKLHLDALTHAIAAQEMQPIKKHRGAS
ncbi:unnamed protein product, partial [Prorocentrum cordatum]